ncbi:ATP-dependent helicase [Natranaerobius thermophilus]|nr:ATP-dependent helicase [Natranaerobius thermophilus]
MRRTEVTTMIGDFSGSGNQNKGNGKDPLDKLIDFSKYKRRKQGQDKHEASNTEESLKNKETNHASIFPSQYPEPPVDDEIRARFQHLQSLIDKINNQLEQEARPGDFPNNISQSASDFKINYPEELNPQQLEAVTYCNGPLLIIAGAGTGKTRTLVYRVSYLLESGIPPQEILLLTFTRKAAREMLERVKKLLGTESTDRIKGGTFHSFANNVLRRYSGLVGLSPDFSVLDQIDSQDVVDLLRTEYDFHRQEKAFPKKERIFEIISKSRNTQKSIGQVISEEFSGLDDYIDEIDTIAQAYHKYKRHYNLMDFDDLLLVLRDNLRDNSTFRKQLSSELSYILVDEFQDTNVVQNEIVNLLGSQSRNITVVGDDFQSIYAFRGANWENILLFPQNYPDAKLIKLEKNYRSHNKILKFANEIVDSAQIGYQKHLSSEFHEGTLPQFIKYYSQEEEAEAIVSEILALREQGFSYKDMAVLYRAGFHGNYIQAELLRRKIPYVVYGGIKFMERKHVKDLVSYLRLTVNPIDAVSWNRFLKMIPGIGRVRASQIVEEITEQDGRLNFNNFKGTSYYKSLLSLQEVLLEAGKKGISPSNSVARIIEYYYPILEKQEVDASERKNDLEVLYHLSQNYSELEQFLADLSLEPPANKFQQETTPALNEAEDDDSLVISTIHSAKGLEWNTVFIPHLLDGLFPSSKSLRDPFILEEERRLFYVAITRAKEKLYLSMPHQVVSYNGYFIQPSRFLKDLDPACYHFQAFFQDNKE